MTMFDTIRHLDRVIVCAQVSKHLAFTFLPKNYVFDQKLILFCYEDEYHFAILQSNIHGEWAWRQSSTMRNAGISYSPTDVFRTFPFPEYPNTQTVTSTVAHGLSPLQNTSAAYFEYRRQIMLDRWEGLTATYNRFHKPDETAEDIARLRQLHVDMDNAVAAAYGWGDLDLGHGFHETAQGIRYTIAEAARRTVLTRLLELNHARYAEEVKAGLHDKKKGKGKAKGKSDMPDGQMEMW